MEINNLTISYKRDKVLNGLSLQIQDQAINGLVGMNGAGKTTLLNAIYGFKEKDEGEVVFENEKLMAHKIGYLETENFFYPKIKGIEYLEIFKQTNSHFNPSLWNEIFELPLNKLVDDYSTGMKKKLALMGVIGLDKPVLLLDEPFNGVDLESNEKIKLIIKKLKERGKTIIVTSHILETLTSICDQISILYNGKIDITAQKDNFQLVSDYLHTNINVLAKSKIDKIFDEQ